MIFEDAFEFDGSPNCQPEVEIECWRGDDPSLTSLECCGVVTRIAHPDRGTGPENDPSWDSPCVHVAFGDGSEERFTAYYVERGLYDETAPFVIDDLEVTG